MEIIYCDVKIDIHPLLAAVFPFHIPPEAWPSYCGAGSGIGDRIVPEKIKMVVVSCLCADHDVRWSTCENSWFAAIQENFVFYKNLRNFVLALRDPEKYSKSSVEAACFRWFLAVCWGARHHFNPLGGGDNGNIETAAKLKKLAIAVAEYEAHNPAASVAA